MLENRKPTDFDRIVRPREAARLLGSSVPSLYRWCREGRLPRPTRFGPGSSGWRLSVLEAFLRRAEEANRDGEAG